MKRIVTIQDISCVGKCSLTVALPIISAMGVEAAILPTAVLSTHTMFQNFTVKDLTDQIEPISEHWKKENFAFDAVYTGYLGSFEQIDSMKKFFEDFKTESNILFVDPAMADNGKLYPAFDEAFAKHMGTLCAKADIIVANLMADLVMKLSAPAALHMNPGGMFISSGILVEKKETVAAAIRAAGFTITQIVTDGEWCAIKAEVR